MTVALTTGGMIAEDPQLSGTDVISPSVANATPAAGTQLEQFDPIGFDVIDLNSGVTAILVHVEFASRRDREVVYDGTRFQPRFLRASTTTTIANGLRFSILPNGGWTDSIDEVFVYAVDADGNIEALPS